MVQPWRSCTAYRGGAIAISAPLWWVTGTDAKALYADRRSLPTVGSGPDETPEARVELVATAKHRNPSGDDGHQPGRPIPPPEPTPPTPAPDKK